MRATEKRSTGLFVAQRPSLRLWVSTPSMVKSQQKKPNPKKGQFTPLYVTVR